ncbi:MULTISPECIES: hypothetical protein [unclassified Chryseobacterium]|uniref:hypothetical protein n=1 Tax=unclassified Chryseobacterium TaxID=2593645 RepID=UPI000E258BE0|nr:MULTISPECIES: hypothetical protein [unclassified Chryseobacterium]REC45560.1 hypothetical protein DRF69_00090 [Chryseobacterium sp. 5_R23647]
MIKNIFLIIVIFSFLNTYAQNFNVILQVNDVNIDGEITAMSLSNNNSRDEERIRVNYYPGDLIIPDYEKLSFEKLNNDFILTFNYNTYKRNSQQIATFNIKLSKELLKQPYLIINIYDFRVKKYKRWFQHCAKGSDYFPQISFQNSGFCPRINK